MRYLSALTLLVLSAAFSSPAQTINAASCLQPDVQTALNSVVASTQVVNIPLGTCHWTSSINFTVPSGSTTLTIQGQTSCNGSGDPAGNNLSCTDRTTIIDDTATLGFIKITTNASTSSIVRITGITWSAGTDNIGFNGPEEIVLTGSSQNVRMDHNHFNMDNNSAWTGAMIGIHNCVYGVIDHNLFDQTLSSNTNTIIFDNGQFCPNDSVEWGDVPWNTATGFGTNQFMYIEQNRFNTNNGSGGLGMMNDCIFSGKFVWRFNSSVNGHLQTHPTVSIGRHRGCRALEIYKNNATNPTQGNISTFMFYSSGPGIFWGNTLAKGYGDLVNLKNCRENGADTCGYGNTPPPNGWGFCGSTGGGPSAWDGNSPATSGYPCIDQPARGKSDLLSGNFPNACDQTLGCVTFNGQWPNQLLEPVYVWLNALDATTNPVDAGLPGGTIFTQNQDYYISSDPRSGVDCAGFTGVTGVGCGTLASRPVACTPGPAGAFGGSPTGSYGVAWWATDQGSWNGSGNGAGQGQLYVCTSTNTWTLAYTPLTYPHPLAGASTAPPLGISGSGTVSGSGIVHN